MPIPTVAATAAKPAPARAVKPEAHSRRWLDLLIFVLIAGGAFLIRYAYMLQARACPLFDVLIMDGRQCFAWATRLVDGDWIGDQVFYQAPLYPYFLAVVRLGVGDDLWSIRLVQIGLGALSCGLLFLAGRAFLSRGAGIAAGLLLAAYPPAIFLDTLVQKAGLGLLWMTLLLWLLGCAQRKPGMLISALIGAALGLLMLTREETMLLAPLILAWIALRQPATTVTPPTPAPEMILPLEFDDGSAPKRVGLWRSVLKRVRARHAAAFVAGLALVLMPAAIRNYAVGGEFVLTTSQAGPNFYIGNNPSANGMYAPLRPGRSNTPYERQDAVDLAQQAMGRTLTASEVSRYWFGRSFEFIQSQPGAWLRLIGRKAALLVNAYEIPDAEDQYFFERFSPLLRTLSGVWHLGVLAPLAAAGMVLTIGRWREVWLLHAITLTLIVGVLLFFVFARYRFPLVPVLMLFAGAAVAHLVGSAVSAARPRSARAPAASLPRTLLTLVAAVLAAAAAAIASNWPLFERDFQLAIAYSNAGAAMADAGDDAAAMRLLNESLRLDPNLPDTLVNKALVHGRAGQLEEAIVLLRQAARQRPDDARIEFRLGTAIAETGDFAEAARHFSRAVQLGPGDIDSRTNYAMVLLHLGRTSAAIEQFHHALRLNPDHVELALTLAWLLATAPDATIADPQTAVTLAEQAARRTERRAPGALDILSVAYARAGRFEEALSTAQEALDLAIRAGEAALAHEIRQRMTLYNLRQPWIQR